MKTIKQNRINQSVSPKTATELGLCWYCNKRPADDDVAVGQKMFLISGGEEGINKLAMGIKEVSCQSKDFKIPRCRLCKDEHAWRENKNSSFILRTLDESYNTIVGLTFLGVGIYSGILIYNARGSIIITILGGLVIGFIGVIPLLILFARLLHDTPELQNIKDEKNIDECPVIKKQLDKGWSFYSPEDLFFNLNQSYVENIAAPELKRLKRIHSSKFKQPAKSVEQAPFEENRLSDEIQTTLNADTSRQFTGLVKRSVNNVWTWFTDFHNWGKWWAPIKSVEGGWTKGGRITWENGDSSELKTVIPPCEFCIDGAFIDLRWCFEPLSDERTRVICELSAPKFGASFSDGGSAAFKSEKESFEKLMSLLNHSDSDLTSDLEATKKPGNNKKHMVDSRGFYDSAPLFLEEEPELEQLFAAPPIIQKPTEYNRDFWASASVEERRMTLVTGYLQHPDPEVRRKSLGLMKKYFTECLAGHAQILVDRLAADPDETVRREVARIIWEYEREVNCEYAVNKLKDEVAFVSEQSLVGPVRARRALDLLAETAPSEETRSALEHQIADLQ